MRLKTEMRREAILETATQLFQEVGYERASMAEISARMGGSKATLYNYFRSKDELFAAALFNAIETQGQQVVDMLDAPNDDVRTVLQRFGEAYLRFITAPETLAITRTAIAEGANSKLGASLYARGPMRAWEEVAAYVQQLQDRGILAATDPMLIAIHLKGLLEAGYVEPLLWGAKTKGKMAASVADAVDVFLRAYSVQ